MNIQYLTLKCHKILQDQVGHFVLYDAVNKCDQIYPTIKEMLYETLLALYLLMT